MTNYWRLVYLQSGWIFEWVWLRTYTYSSTIVHLTSSACILLVRKSVSSPVKVILLRRPELPLICNNERTLQVSLYCSTCMYNYPYKLLNQENSMQGCNYVQLSLAVVAPQCEDRQQWGSYEGPQTHCTSSRLLDVSSYHQMQTAFGQWLEQGLDCIQNSIKNYTCSCA